MTTQVSIITKPQTLAMLEAPVQAKEGEVISQVGCAKFFHLHTRTPRLPTS
jgi:hypothetical protein